MFEIRFKCLLLLEIKLFKKVPDTVFGFLNLVGLHLEIGEFTAVLFKPLLTVTILSWEFLEILGQAVDLAL